MDLANELIKANHSLKEKSEELLFEEMKCNKLKIDHDLLKEKAESSQRNIEQLETVNQTILHEFEALKNTFDLLQDDFNRLKPSYIELEQKYVLSERTNQQLEKEIILIKHKQVDLLNSEVEKHAFRMEEKHRKVSEDELVIIPAASVGSLYTEETLINSTSRNSIINNGDSISESSLTSSQRRESNGTRLNSQIQNVITSIFRRPTLMSNVNPDRLYRPPVMCFNVSVPRKELTKWDCTDGEVYAVQFHPSGSLMATGGSDRIINLWEITSTGQQRKYCSLAGSSGAINAIDFDSEGARLIAGCSNDKAYIWSYREGILREALTGHTAFVFCAKFISSTKVATGSRDSTIRVWDLQQRQTIRTLFAGSKCHDLIVTDAAGSLITGHFDKKIRIWDTFTDIVRTELTYDAAVTSLSFNNEKQLLLGCFKNDTLKIIDLRVNKVFMTLSHDDFSTSMETTKAILSPDGNYACAGSHTGAVVVWNVNSGQAESVLKKHSFIKIDMDWKADILRQIKERNRKERDIYAEIVKHYNRLIENHSIILLRCTEQEKDILSLRQENTDLQKNSVSLAGLTVNEKIKSVEDNYMKAKDEVLTLLRERGEV
ncbi:unnamed protein product, partial [Didymodactylos carnosus]